MKPIFFQRHVVIVVEVVEAYYGAFGQLLEEAFYKVGSDEAG